MDHPNEIVEEADHGRPRYRQPIGMPMRDEGRRAGAVVSVVVHALIIFLLIVPFFMPRSVIQRMQQGAGGAGPAGGGGGVGAGVGTGKGSGTGAGTGGGTQANYPPVPIEFFLPPMPPPSSVRGQHFTAEFDVDSTGRVLAFDFTPTRDGDYNKRISQVLRAMKFRPGTRPDGSPLRMKAQVGYEF
jgi:hypothetical protein